MLAGIVGLAKGRTQLYQGCSAQDFTANLVRQERLSILEFVIILHGSSSLPVPASEGTKVSE